MKKIILMSFVFSFCLLGFVYAEPTSVKVFIPEDIPQGPIPYDTEVRVDFSREVLDPQHEFDTTNKEYVAKRKQTVLVNTGIRYTNVTQNSDYCLSIRSTSPIVNMQEAVTCEKAPQTTSSQFGVDLHLTTIITLKPGQKIWVTANHFGNVNPTIYWRDAVTYLQIQELD